MNEKAHYILKINMNIFFYLLRYKLHLVVLDSTNDTKFLLFDNLAMQLLHEPCLELTGPVTDEVLLFSIIYILIFLSIERYIETYYDLRDCIKDTGS